MCKLYLEIFYFEIYHDFIKILSLCFLKVYFFYTAQQENTYILPKSLKTKPERKKLFGGVFGACGVS